MAVAAAFVLGVALLITLTGPLALFNPWFVSLEQSRHDVAAAFGGDAAALDPVTADFVADLFTGGEFDPGL